jgi:hypothetical protein
MTYAFKQKARCYIVMVGIAHVGGLAGCQPDSHSTQLNPGISGFAEKLDLRPSKMCLPQVINAMTLLPGRPFSYETSPGLNDHGRLCPIATVATEFPGGYFWTLSF